VAGACHDVVDLRGHPFDDVARPRATALERTADQRLVEQGADRVSEIAPQAIMAAVQFPASALAIAARSFGSSGVTSLGGPGDRPDEAER